MDPNEFINKLRSQAYGKAYKVNDRAEFLAVYNTLKTNLISTENFEKRLNGIILRKTDTIEGSEANWNPRTNTITYVNDIDLIHELFHVASTSDKSITSGITKYIPDGKSVYGKKVNYGLDEGITDMFAEMADNNVPIGYPFEKMCAETLYKLFGIEVFQGYFSNSYDNFINSFPDEIKIDIIDIIDNLDKYHDLMNSIYNSQEFVNITDTIDIIKITSSNNEIQKRFVMISELTDAILRTFLNIANAIGRDKNEIIDFFSTKANDLNIQCIRGLISLDEAINNNRSIELK